MVPPVHTDDYESLLDHALVATTITTTRRYPQSSDDPPHLFSITRSVPTVRFRDGEC
jgi:hypothetical protein